MCPYRGARGRTAAARSFALEGPLRCATPRPTPQTAPALRRSAAVVPGPDRCGRRRGRERDERHGPRRARGRSSARRRPHGHQHGGPAAARRPLSRSCRRPPTRTRRSTPARASRRATPTSSACSAPRSSTTTRWRSARCSPTVAAQRRNRARRIGDGLVFAQEHDPDHDDGRLRQGYNVGPYTFYDGTPQPYGFVRPTVPRTSAGSSGSSARPSATWRGPASRSLSCTRVTRDPRYRDAAVRIGEWITTNTWSTAAARWFLVRCRRRERARAQRLDRAQRRLRRVLHHAARAPPATGVDRGRRRTPARSSTACGSPRTAGSGRAPTTASRSTATPCRSTPRRGAGWRCATAGTPARSTGPAAALAATDDAAAADLAAARRRAGLRASRSAPRRSPRPRSTTASPCTRRASGSRAPRSSRRPCSTGTAAATRPRAERPARAGAARAGRARRRSAPRRRRGRRWRRRRVAACSTAGSASATSRCSTSARRRGSSSARPHEPVPPAPQAEPDAARAPGGSRRRRALLVASEHAAPSSPSGHGRLEAGASGGLDGPGRRRSGARPFRRGHRRCRPAARCCVSILQAGMSERPRRRASLSPSAPTASPRQRRAVEGERPRSPSPSAQHRASASVRRPSRA